MDDILKHAQEAGDNLEKDGTLTEEMKEKFPRPETNEDVYKILSHNSIFNGYGFNSPSPLLAFLFGMILGSFGGGGCPSPLYNFSDKLNEQKSIPKEESQDEKIDE